MPLTARSMRNRFAWGIQSAEGTPQTTNASLYEVSMYAGGLHPMATRAPFATSDAQDVAENFYFQRFDWNADAEIALDVDSIGSLFVAHLGTDTPSGAGPYTHVITKSAPGWVTMYEMFPGVAGGTDYWVKAPDGVVRGLEISVSPGDTLHAKIDAIGKTATFNPTVTPAATRDMRIATVSPTGSIATPITATLNLQPTGAQTQVHNIETLTITSAYANAELIQTDESTPRYLSLGAYTCGFVATVVLTATEFQYIAGTMFGSTTITTDMVFPTNPPAMTSVAPTFTFNTVGGTASRSVAFAFGAQQVTTEFADVNPNGEAVRMTLTGDTVYNAAPLTVTAINNRAAY